MQERQMDTPGYHVLILVFGAVLSVLAVLTGTYMNFKLGFFDAGSLLCGVLGSSLVVLYGKQAFHGANYLQTMASGAGSLAAMSAITQLFYWRGIELPNIVLLTVFALAIAMYGVGWGMRTTPLLIDQWKLPFPGGRAVAETLRTLADKALLRKSLFTMGGGGLFGYLFEGGVMSLPPAWLFNAPSLAAGMIVTARIAFPAITLGLTGWLLTPWLREIGYLQPDQPFFRWGFYVALAMILGSSAVRVLPSWIENLRRLKSEPAQGSSSSRFLWPWIGGWGVVVLLCGWLGFGVSPLYILVAELLVAIFVLTNGISVGVANANPISSAFAVTVLILMLLGVPSAKDALFASMVVFVGVANGTDMQGDRAVGTFLGASRMKQWWYNAAGVLIGAPLAVFLASLFLESIPALTSQTTLGKQWTSAMTIKMDGILQAVAGGYQSHQLVGLGIGLFLGVLIELLRNKLRKRRISGGQPSFSANPRIDFLMDAVVLPSPAAAAFGGFIPLPWVLWYGAGGVIDSLHTWVYGNPREREGVKAPILCGSGLLVGGGLAVLYAIIASLK